MLPEAPAAVGAAGPAPAVPAAAVAADGPAAADDPGTAAGLTPARAGEGLRTRVGTVGLGPAAVGAAAAPGAVAAGLALGRGGTHWAGFHCVAGRTPACTWSSFSPCVCRTSSKYCCRPEDLLAPPLPLLLLLPLIVNKVAVSRLQHLCLRTAAMGWWIRAC